MFPMSMNFRIGTYKWITCVGIKMAFFLQIPIKPSGSAGKVFALLRINLPPGRADESFRLSIFLHLMPIAIKRRKI